MVIKQHSKYIMRIFGSATLVSVLMMTACTYSERALEKVEAESVETARANKKPIVMDVQSSLSRPPADASVDMVAHAPEPQAEIILAGAGSARLSAPMKLMSGRSYYSQPQQREKYAEYEANSIKITSSDPVSTFSIDVDTGSYALVRDRLRQGNLPDPAAVRIEEMINYFDYDYPQPKGDTPFSVTMDTMVTPWNKHTHLMRVGLKGKEFKSEERLAANLVFLLDVSGSMNNPDKLPLLKKSMEFLAGQLNEDDRISIVVYAGAAGLVLDVTEGSQKAKIRNAISRLSAGGSTAGGAGIQLAYATARQAFIEGGINRIILATDGDFNVGTSDVTSLKKLIGSKRDSGISLTTLGFGDGNYNDELMEQIADVGNGNYAYIDSFNEARRVLGSQMNATLRTIAKDVKIQVEFNPDVVAEYRLIGYENRVLAREDFNNDKVDAGEIGAGHSVTALYEVAIVGSEGLSVDPLRYKNKKTNKPQKKTNEMAYVKIRYKKPDGNESILIKQAVLTKILNADKVPHSDLMYAASIAGYGQLLAGSDYVGNLTFAKVGDLAKLASGDNILRNEFLSLVQITADLKKME